MPKLDNRSFLYVSGAEIRLGSCFTHSALHLVFESYTNDFKRELKEKRPELTNKVPSELEGFRRPKWTSGDGFGTKNRTVISLKMVANSILNLSVFYFAPRSFCGRTDRQEEADRQEGRQTGRRTDRQAGGQTDRQVDRQTDEAA